MDMREARAMVKALRSTEGTAPEGMAEDVLAGIGLVDSWTEIDGPIGPLFVAWSEATGIPAAERSGDPAGSEPAYELRHGRPVRRVPEMPEELLAQIRKRFEGGRTTGPRVDLDTLTEFEMAVLLKSMECP